MQRPIFVRRPLSHVATHELPPMYTWPRPIKYAIISVCVLLCIIAYTAMASGIISLATLVLDLV